SAVLFSMAFLYSSIAFGGVLNSPLPNTLSGTGLRPVTLFTMTGIRTDANTTLSVHCTNLHPTADVEYGVEVFDYDNTQLNSAGGGNSEVMGPGETRTIELDDVGNGSAFYAADQNITLSTNPNQGSARIIATSGAIMCTATLTGKTNPPTPL